MEVGRLGLDTVVTGLASPVYLTAPAGAAGQRRLFVVEQQGRIRLVVGDVLRPTPFLDITEKVGSGGERGLLSVAFHPQYATNGFLYVHYTDRNGHTRIERYTAPPGGDAADPSSAKLILAQNQPYANHNGGLNLFGPDGMLYIGIGDGGSGGDPHSNGQSRTTMLGKILRIDVDRGDPYGVPATNPFAGPLVQREIWAIGLRNPWRFAFDPVDFMLYVADVGQNAWEEINVVPAAGSGVNYGWRIMEGTHCYGATDCDRSGLTLPVVEYGHTQGCSITGGFVYRGRLMPALAGHYFYSDYCSGFLRSFRWTGGRVTESREWEVGGLGNVLSFGQDSEGELYVLNAAGTVVRLVPDST